MRGTETGEKKRKTEKQKTGNKRKKIRDKEGRGRQRLISQEGIVGNEERRDAIWIWIRVSELSTKRERDEIEDEDEDKYGKVAGGDAIISAGSQTR